MKRNCIIILVAALLASCGKPTGELIETKTYSYEKSVYADSKKTAQMNIEMDVEYPTACVYPELLDTLQRFVISKTFATDDSTFSVPATTDPKEAMRIVGESLIKTYIEDNSYLPGELTEEKLETPIYFNGEYDLTAEVEGITDDVLSYHVQLYSYYGGAHGYLSDSYYNIDLSTGRLLTDEDIFPDLSSEQVAELLRDALVMQTEKTPAELEEEGYSLESLVPNGNFFLTQDNVFYHYNQYDIAPYAVGSVTIGLPRKTK